MEYVPFKGEIWCDLGFNNNKEVTPDSFLINS
jgi:hypothetical protein